MATGSADVFRRIGKPGGYLATWLPFAISRTKTMHHKVKAWRVLSDSVHVYADQARDAWRNLAEIHAAPRWLCQISGTTKPTGPSGKCSHTGNSHREVPLVRLGAA